MALIDFGAAPPARRHAWPSAGELRRGAVVSFVRAAACEKLLPEWRGLADQSLDDNPFMLPEFVQPAAAHLSAGADPLLVAVWTHHIRSRELIGLFAVTLQRAPGPAGWVRQRRVSLWRHPSLPLAPFLL
ncbi:MAG: hypothetical protein ACRCTI_06090, partial [Beijerinckiaceae bacterium]